jgi:hypothetical protein
MIACLPYIVCACASPAAAETISLVKEGAATATIVMPADPAPEIGSAAAELSAYVAKMCGVALPIRADGKPVEGTGLYLGACDLSRASDLPVVATGRESFAREAFAIRVREGNVFFAGRTTPAVCHHARRLLCGSGLH